jgi:glutathionylspermidine synthase
MLRKDICVIEPMWKMLAGNKALLPYLVQEAPGHENLLDASFELTPSLRKSGYVSKPVSGRAGQNISIHAAEDHDHHTEEPSTPHTTDEREGVENDSFDEATGGRFADKNVVYQEKLHLKQYDGYFPILCAWVVDDSFAGIVIREDTSLITRLESIVAPSRVVRW